MRSKSCSDLLYEVSRHHMGHKQKTKNLGMCVICGVRNAMTKDHVPPKGIFCKPRPANLVRVPACQVCNNGASGLDEKFRVYLGLHVSEGGGAAARFFREEAIRTLRYDRKLRETILSKIEPVWMSTPQGIIYDRGFRVLWDSAGHDAIVERTIRGLYFHHFGEILANRACIKVHWLRELTSEMVDISRGWSLASFGQGECTYKFRRADESPLDSVWIFRFYGAHWASGYTTPQSREPDQSIQPTAYRSG